MNKKPKNDRPKLDADALAVWDSLVANLNERISDEDALALELLATSFVALRESLQAYRTAPIITLHNGIKAVSPHLKAIAVLRREVDEGFRRFGVGPANRAKLNLSTLDEEARREEAAFAAEFD